MMGSHGGDSTSPGNSQNINSLILHAKKSKEMDYSMGTPVPQFKKPGHKQVQQPGTDSIMMAHSLGGGQGIMQACPDCAQSRTPVICRQVSSNIQPCLHYSGLHHTAVDYITDLPTYKDYTTILGAVD